MKRFKNILFVSENGVGQEATLARAANLAQVNGARITCIDVISERFSRLGMPSNGEILKGAREWALSESSAVLESLVEPYRDKIDIRAEVLCGEARFLEVVRAVLGHNYDLVIKTAEDPEWLDRLFGSDDMHLLRKCPCPVWLTKQYEKPRYKNVLAAVDFDLYNPGSNEALLNHKILGLAASLAFADGANLHIVHAYEALEASFLRSRMENGEAVAQRFLNDVFRQHSQQMDQLLSYLKQEFGAETYARIKPKTHLPEGPAHRVIPLIAKEQAADIVVMGTVARTGVPGLIIGNTAESILDQLKCSLMAVKPTGFVTPVKLH